MGRQLDQSQKNSYSPKGAASWPKLIVQYLVGIGTYNIYESLALFSRNSTWKDDEKRKVEASILGVDGASKIVESPHLPF